MASLSGRRRDIEIHFTVPGAKCNRPGIVEGKLMLVSINDQTGVMVVHCAAETRWWGQANHYCPARFKLFTFDPAEVKNLDNTRRVAFVSVTADCSFKANSKTWGIENATDARVI